ncbi:uncharacterized protein LOC129767124 [Toxorhynchites rutilus septentrionalis]|uniref:uncharacterized protein LOC129767124 n=1 Tax=Toxorhynchites rutilus septentrionalis TaxID=329112 RepID=UPI0024798407|nr:uncharacterized protein LOC129767124 [Toxorhynchites rutilus septentrionalis]
MENHCLMCDRPDNADNLVQCDKCDGYVHFSCADVGESIADADRSFTCKKCVESEEAVTISSQHTSKRSHASSRSSISARRTSLRLQQIETDRQNRLKELDDAEKYQRMRRQVEADFDKQRFQVLDAQQEEVEQRSTRSRSQPGSSPQPVDMGTHRIEGSALQRTGLAAESNDTQMPSQVSSSIVTRPQEGGVPVTTRSQLDVSIPAAVTAIVSVTDGNRVELINPTHVNPVVNQVRKGGRKTKVDEIVNTSTPKQSHVVTNENVNQTSQLVVTSSKNDYIESACLYTTSRSQFPQTVHSNTKPAEGAHVTASLGSVLKPPSGHGQGIDLHPSLFPPPSGRIQFDVSNSLKPPPPSGQKQNVVSNPLSAMK